MDEQRRALDHAVSQAADAWLTDPTDPGAYSRLVTAVLARRAYLHPQLTPDPPEPAVAVAIQPDEVLDELAGRNPPVRLASTLPDTSARLRARHRRDVPDQAPGQPSAGPAQS